MFDLGQLATLRRLLDRYGPPARRSRARRPGHGRARRHAGDRAGADRLPAARCPPGATFAATGVGRTSLPVMLAALSAGGHLRVGMEDTLTYAPGEPVRDNAQLVARAAGLARIAQRPPMSTDDARSLLGIKPMEAAAVSPKPPPPVAPPSTSCSTPRSSRTRRTQPMTEVRRLRREAEQEEVNLSYTRRLLQGRLDIVRRELQRRAEHDGRSLVDLLPEILVGEGPRARARAGPAPDGAAARARGVRVLGQRADPGHRHVRRVATSADAKLEKAARALAEAESGAVRAPPRRAAGDGRAGRRARPPVPRRRGRRRRAAGRRRAGTERRAGSHLAWPDNPVLVEVWRSGLPRVGAPRVRWSCWTPTAR